MRDRCKDIGPVMREASGGRNSVCQILGARVSSSSEDAMHEKHVRNNNSELGEEIEAEGVDSEPEISKFWSKIERGQFCGLCRRVVEAEWEEKCN